MFNKKCQSPVPRCRLPAFVRLSSFLAACFLIPASASAALVAYDGFEYDISGGAGLSGKGSAADGWEASWSGSGTIVEDNMAYSTDSLLINGGSQSLRINGTNNAYFTRQFEAITDASEVYFSFLFKSEAGANSDYLNFWLSHDADRANSGGIGDVAGNSQFGVRLFGDDTVPNNSVQSNEAYAFDGTVFLLVGRISTDGTSGADAGIFDQIELWVNPDSTTLGTPVVTSDLSTQLSNSVGLSFFGLQTSSVGGTDDYRIDEFRVGTSAAGVLTVIPEPSSTAALLGGLALLIFIGRRVRR